MEITEGKVSLAVYTEKEENTRNDIDPKGIDKTSDFAKWGVNNQQPFEVLKEGKNSGVWVGGMKVLRHSHYGNGFQFYKMAKKENSDKISKQMLDISETPEEIQKFWRRSKMDLFFLERIYDLETHYIAFDEYILSKDFSKINRVKRIEAAHCRFSLKHQKTKLIEYVYIKSDWKNNDVKEASKVNHFDFHWSPDEIKEYCEKKNIRKFIRSCYYPRMVKTYYPDPDYLATFRNGWLRMCNTIPELKTRVINQKLHFDYIVYVSDEYFERIYKDDWDDFTTEKRSSIRTDLYTAIDEHLAGKQGVGRSLKSPKFKNSKGDWVKGIEVETIDKSKGDTDTSITDATAGNQETLFAMGIDPAIIGASVPGSKGSAGSGSDKRIAYYMLSTLKNPDRVISTDTYYFIAEWNDWPLEYKGNFSIPVLTTLDKNPTGTENKM